MRKKIFLSKFANNIIRSGNKRGVEKCSLIVDPPKRENPLKAVPAFLPPGFPQFGVGFRAKGGFRRKNSGAEAATSSSSPALLVRPDPPEFFPRGFPAEGVRPWAV